MANASVPPSPKADAADGDLTYAEAEAILRELAGQQLTTLNGHDSFPAAPSARAPSSSAEPARTPAADPHDLQPLTGEALRGLIDAMPDGLVVADRAGRIVLVNTQTESLFGYPRDALVGQAIEILLPERFRERHVLQRDVYLAAPHTRPMGAGLDLVGRRRDGTEMPVEISLSPLAPGGGPLVVASIRDVTARRQADAHLRKVEARYRTLIEKIPAVTFMAAMDEEANELYVSPQIEQLLGFTQREWLDDPILWYTQLHPDDQSRWHEDFARTVASGETFRSTYRFLARDGRVVWVHGEAQLIYDEAGRPAFLHGMAFDVTRIKEAEEELRRLNATLEERVSARTAESERRAQELARSNKALEEFGYVVTHDLRQPLRTMKSYIQKLSKGYAGRFDAEADDYIARSVNASDRMRVLIDDLLAYSRVGTEGKEPSAVPAAESLEGALANLQAAIEECGAVVRVGEMPVVAADPTQLSQLFQNLIGNALKFRAEGRVPEVEVTARRGEGRWVFDVADNGIGIEAEYMHKIFKLGVESRLHGASKYPGHGIGLATCEKIVQRHGGRIWVTSDGPDRGTTISFSLPAAPE